MNVYTITDVIPSSEELTRLQQMLRAKSVCVTFDFRYSGFILDVGQPPNESKLTLMQIAFPHWGAEIIPATNTDIERETA